MKLTAQKSHFDSFNVKLGWPVGDFWWKKWKTKTV